MNYKEITLKLGKKVDCSTCESNMVKVCGNTYYGIPLINLTKEEINKCDGWDIDLHTFILGIDKGLIVQY